MTKLMAIISKPAWMAEGRRNGPLQAAPTKPLPVTLKYEGSCGFFLRVTV